MTMADLTEWNQYLSTLESSSKLKYKRCIADYIAFCQRSTIDLATPNSVLQYLRALREPQQEEDEGEKGYAASTLWSFTSIIGTFLFSTYKINGIATKKGIVGTTLSQWEKQDLVKKALTFTKDDVATFINRTTNPANMVYKLAMIIGISGLLRKKEIYELQYENVHLSENEIRIAVLRKKNKGPKEGSYILLTDPLYITVIREYTSRFPSDYKGPLFHKLKNDLTPILAVRIGENTLGEFAKKIALDLNKQDHEKYTSHSFRRSGATFLADAGASLLTLKQAGGWRSDTVAQQYVQKSAVMERTIAEALQVNTTSREIRSETINQALEETNKELTNLMQNISLNNCSNVTINYYNNPSSSSQTTRSIKRHDEEQIQEGIFSKRTRTEQSAINQQEEEALEHDAYNETEI